MPVVNALHAVRVRVATPRLAVRRGRDGRFKLIDAGYTAELIRGMKAIARDSHVIPDPLSSAFRLSRPLKRQPLHRRTPIE